MKHLGTRELETDRLNLRRFKLDDYEEMYNNWAKDEEVTRYLTWPVHESKDMTKEILSIWVEDYKLKDSYEWAIEIKNTEEIIGSIGLVGIDEDDKQVEVGYVIGKDYWGNGYVPEALERVCDFCFCDLGVETIMAKHHKDNINSGKVMEKVGMTFKEEKEINVGKLGLYTARFYAINREDWDLIK